MKITKKKLINFEDLTDPYKDFDRAKELFMEQVLESSPMFNEVVMSKVLGLIQGPKILVDVGSNIGAFIAHAGTWFDKVYAYEPVESIYKHSITMLQAIPNFPKNYKICNLAVGAKTGDTIEIMKNPNNETKDCSRYIPNAYDGDVILEREICETISLEDIYKTNGIDHIDFLKVDIEGSEYEFLMNKDLSNIHILAIEIHPGLVGEKKIFDLVNYINKKMGPPMLGAGEHLLTWFSDELQRKIAVDWILEIDRRLKPGGS